MNLLKKLTLVVVGVGLPSLFLYTASALWFARYGISQSVSDTQLAFGQQAMATLDRTIYDKIDKLRLVAGSGSIKSAVSPMPTPTAQSTAMARFAEIKSMTDTWELFRLVSPTGTIKISSDARYVGTTVPTSEPYQTAMEQALQGKTSYSDVFIDEQTKAPALVVATPVSTTSQVDGVLIGNLAWQSILEALQETKGTSIELFNSEGLELGDSNAANGNEILRDSAKDVPIVQRAMRGEVGTEEVSSLHQADQQVLASFVQQKGYKDYRGSGWVLVAETPTASAYAAVNNVVPVLIPTFMGLAVVVYVLTIALIYKTLVRPVKEVIAVTKRIAAGDMSSRVRVRTADEIGQLGTSFNSMTDKLQALYDDLESKVREKTAQLDARMRESETARARDEAILAGMGEGLIALDEHNQVVLANVRVAELLGIDREELLQKPLAATLDVLRDARGNLLAPKDRPETIAYHTKRAVSEDYMYRRHLRDGTQLAINIHATPIVNDGRVVGVVLVVRDITREKEVDRMKTEFISLASHQLRTPLSAIKWFSQILVKGGAGALNEEQVEFTKNIADSTDRMIELVNSLLNISRIESGQIIVDPKPTDLKELVTAVVRDLHARIDGRHQKLVVKVHPGVPTVNLDAQLIRQVYQNLLVNAIKYTPDEGKVSVVISHQDHEIVSQISDTGFGIPRNQQAKIFNKFFRADNVAKFVPDGTGLGLYLVKAIIESSGGKIWFTSQEGKGTTFWFSLPESGMRPKEGEVVLDA